MSRERVRPRRRSIRLNGFDYAGPGAYFITIVTQNRLCLFGDICGDQMQLNSAGEMIACWWSEVNRRFTSISTEEFVVMPNHCHGIIALQGPAVGADLGVGPPKPWTGAHPGAPLPKIIQWFKTMTTNEYIRGVKRLGWPSFQNRLWQRNYYEHVVRNDDSLARIRQYIVDNPARWAFDRENPINQLSQ